MSTAQQQYYVPHGTVWPLVVTIGIFLAVIGFVNMMHGAGGIIATPLFVAGLGVIFYVAWRWFAEVVNESMGDLYSPQVDRSFRMGMTWFIFSEVMFFLAFFGALFYARVLTIPWLAGAGSGEFNTLLWPEFVSSWPLLVPPSTEGLSIPTDVIPAWGLPALNTAILLTSGVTITFAHIALKKENRQHLILWMAATVLLGVVFMYFQATEYGHAYHDLNLKMDSGIYGNTFYMLTGFHGFHVALGTLMLLIILLRCMRGHFTPKNHFAFEAVAWYWHFVDVVWLGLFIFVYWI